MPKSIRARITLWHLGVLILTILLFMLFLQAFLWRQLHVELRSSLHDDVEMVERFLEPDGDGNIVWRSHDGFGEDQIEGRWIEVLYPDGREIFRNFTRESPFTSLRSDESGLHKEKFTLTVANGSRLYGMQGRHRIQGKFVEIRVARSNARIYEEMGHLLLAQSLCLPLVILIAWSAGYFVAGRMLTPLKKIIHQVQTISVDRLGDRLVIENPDDELGHLSATFNSMLAKLDSSFDRTRQFTADASHELRTPLAAIRSVGEIALRSDSDEDDVCRETIASILEEADKMTHLVEDLLVMARADSMESKTIPMAEELGKLIKEEISLFGVLAEEKAQHVRVNIEESCLVFVDRNIFRLALGNILHNAIKFTPMGGEIEISVRRRGTEQCIIAISDSGPGIEAQYQDRIFERFFRIGKDRSRETGGSGLGLAIAKWAVEVNGGCIELSSVKGSGSVFRIGLPLYEKP